MTGVSRYLTAKSAVEQMRRSEESHASSMLSAESTRGINQSNLAIKKAEHEATVKRDTATQALLRELNSGGSGGGAMLGQPGAAPGESTMDRLYAANPGVARDLGNASGQSGSRPDEEIMADIHAINPAVGKEVDGQRKAKADREAAQKEAFTDSWAKQAKSIRDGGLNPEDEKEYLNTLFASGVENEYLSPEDADRLSDSYQQAGSEAFWKAASPYMDDDGGGKDLKQDIETWTDRDGHMVNLDMNNPRTNARLTEGGDLEGYTPFRPKQTNVNLSGKEERELSKTEQMKQADYESATKAYFIRSNELLKDLENNPQANTFGASLSRVGMNIIADANSIAEAWTGDSDFRNDIIGYNAEAENSAFEKLGIDNAVMRAQISSLAYIQAKMNDRGGRVTDADFANAIDQIGADNSNAKLFGAALRKQMKLNGLSFEADFITRFPESGERDRSWMNIHTSEGIRQPKDRAELDSYPAGTEYMAPDGSIWVKD